MKSITVLKYQTKKSMKEVKDGWYESAIALATSVWEDDNQHDGLSDQLSGSPDTELKTQDIYHADNTTLVTYKLFRKRKDGTYGPLFINRRQKLEKGIWYDAECHPTRGFAVRPGWHTSFEPAAPHLSKKGRVWCKVVIDDYTLFQRPKSQGGLWFIANKMKILEQL